MGKTPRKAVNQDAKRARTRARLTQAALKLMSERGINATSVSEIASAAELANGTFYLYFRDKAEIVAAVCRGAGARAGRPAPGPDVSARAAEYQLRILGMSAADARQIRNGGESQTGG